MITSMTVKETAEILRVKPQTVRFWIKRGKLPANKIGKHYLISMYNIGKMTSRNEDNIKIKSISENRTERIKLMRGKLSNKGISFDSLMSDREMDIIIEDKKVRKF